MTEQFHGTAEFAGQVAVVTGAASGIGYAIAQHLAERGARLAGVDVRAEVSEHMDELPGEGHWGIIVDLTEPGAAERVATDIVAELGVPAILVNSAGIGRMDQAVSLSPEIWHQTLAVNLSASFFMAQAVGRLMVEAGYGRIINIASQAAELGLKGHAAYSASKAGVLGFTRVLAVEWARSGVTVNAVSPTIVATALGKRVWAGEAGEKAREEIPAGRFAEPEEVAGLVGYLAGKRAGMVNGENLVIDGARSVI